MSNIALLISCILSGFLLRRTSLFDANSAKTLNALIIYFFIPVITLHHVPHIEFQATMIWLSVTPFMVYAASFLFFRGLRRFRLFDTQTEGALIMTSGIGSTSFVGFPIFEILYGPEGLTYGIILSLAGTVLAFNTVGIATGLYYAQQEPNYAGLLKRIFRFAPFLAFLAALAINITGISIPQLVQAVLTKLAAPFSVLALLAIGMQIDLRVDRAVLKGLAFGHAFKLLLAPVLVYVFLWYIIGTQDLVATICVLGAAIGSMNAISIIAAQLGLNPRLSTLMPVIGIPISIPLLFLMAELLR